MFKLHQNLRKRVPEGFAALNPIADEVIYFYEKNYRVRISSIMKDLIFDIDEIYREIMKENSKGN